MSERASLLMLPVEIRCQVYSYFYLDEVNVDFVLSRKHHSDRPLLYTCSQLYHEILGYYYTQNSFMIQLLDWEDTEPFRWGSKYAITGASLAGHHIDRVERLRIQINSTFWRDSYYPASPEARLHAYRRHIDDCAKELINLVNVLQEVETKAGGLRLRKLEVVDHPPICLNEHQHSEAVEKIPAKVYTPIVEKIEDGLRVLSVNVEALPHDYNPSWDPIDQDIDHRSISTMQI